jgi:HEAT repeat protein
MEDSIMRCILSVAIAFWGGLALVAAEPSEAKIAELIRQLGDVSFELREKASKELVTAGLSALVPLREAAQSSDLEVARRATVAIAKIEKNQKIAVLAQTLQNDPDPKRRVKAAVALHEFKEEPALFVAVAIRAMDDAHLEVRCCAAALVGQLGPAARVAIPRILAILRDNKEPDDMRWCMAMDLANLGGCEEQAVPTLLELLESESPVLRHAAADALGRLGGKDKRVVGALLKAVRDPVDRVRSGAASSLGRLGKEPELCVPPLMEILQSSKNYRGASDPRNGAISALRRFGTKSAPAVPAIIDIVEGKTSAENSLRCKAILALGDIGPAAQAAIPSLRALKTSLRFRAYANDALSRITGVTEK